MSWVEELARVYELCCGTDSDEGNVMLPVGHTTNNAQLTVSLNSDGTIPISGFAVRVPKEDEVTVIPATESSMSRSSGIAPHPLNDKLKYIAGDYSSYCIVKKLDNSEHHRRYMELLKSWCDSPYSNTAVRAVYSYLSRGTLIADLVAAGALEADPSTGRFSGLKLNGIDQEDCFVRFVVDGVKTWKSQELFDSFIGFYESQLTETPPVLCYATGKVVPATYKHPSKIRNSADKGKLFSTNDESGFSYRGRFSDKTEAVAIGYDFSQKLHIALKWLIRRQAARNDYVSGLCVVSWESAMKYIPDVIGSGDEFFAEEEPEGYDPGKAEKNRLGQSLTGWRNADYDKDSRTMIMTLDSAVTGRLSMTMYCELPTSDFLKNLEKWHSDLCWNKGGKPGSFSMTDIAKAAFGISGSKGVDCPDDVRRETVQRLIPCAAEGRRLPRDIVNAAFRRACRPTAYLKKYPDDRWKWRSVLYCACGLYRRQMIEEKGECTMALDTESRSRDYLYGRLLAAADRAEESTYEKGSARPTNAVRFFEAFSNHPYTTWAVIRNNLNPYLERMNQQSRSYFKRVINEITELFDHQDFMDNSPLSPEFLHAYSCQLNAFYKKNETENTNKEED